MEKGERGDKPTTSPSPVGIQFIQLEDMGTISDESLPTLH
jgi:hypothetical protein